MTRRTPIVAALCGLLLASAVLPPAAYAQRHAVVRGGGSVRGGVVVAPRRSVVVGGYYRPYYYRPYYRPYYYGGFAYYGGFGLYGFYDPFYYPYYGYGPYPYYGYGYYGRYDMSSSMRLQVSPRNTEVFLDGYYAGTVDDFDGFFQRLHVEPGEHDLQLYLSGYRSVSQKVYLQPGNTFRVKHAMEPLGPGEQEPARPTATAPPPQAQQQRQGPAVRPQARGPVRAPAPAPSSPNATYGTLTLRVQPGVANVRIDGEHWDGPEGDERLVVQLAAGRHVIEIHKDGYREYMTEVNVRSGETATLNVALTRN